MIENTKVTRLTARCKFVVLLLCVCLSSVSVADESTLALATHTTSVRVRDHSDLEKLEAKVKSAVQTALSATVSVQVGRGAGGGFAFGSGVLVSDDGFVLTAAHVSSRPNQNVVFRFADGRTARGITLGLQKDLDMGLMRITDAGGPWPYLKRARSSKVRAGDWVISTGYPGGFDLEAPSLVRLGRVLKKTQKVILTDCTLVGGDSGGPLVDINGNLIGIHSRIGADLTTNLHVPIDRFAESWDRLARKEVWGLLVTMRPWIGVEHNRSFSEARVQQVRVDSPAARAGLMAGDTVVGFDGTDIRSFEQLKRLVAERDPGSQVPIKYKRGKSYYDSVMEIGKQQSHQDSQTRDDAELLKDWLERIDLRRRRGRAIVGIGKNSDQVKESFHDVLDAASKSTVEVIDSGTLVALGTVVGERLILTKASQLRGTNLRCRIRNTRSFTVEKVSELREYDLALLKASRPLPKVRMRATTTPPPGALLASSGLNVWPLAIGVTSSSPMKIPSEGKIGIRMKSDLAIVDGLVPGSGAENAGMQLGDFIIAVNDVQISTAQELISIVTKQFAGDVLRLTVRRGDKILEFPVELFRHSEFDEALAEFEDFIGGNLSERRTGFERVLQHDTAIRPLHCGGPVVDIQGRFVGINIARAARTTSFLLPAEEVKIALAKLMERRTDALLTVDVGAVNK